MSQNDVTLLLDRLAAGDRSAIDALIPLVYADLRALAGGMFREERANHTLQPTAVVHEAFLRLTAGGGTGRNRAQFMAVAAKVMRQLLIDHARTRRRQKRGGGAQPVSLIGLEGTPSPDGGPSEVDVLDLDDALQALAREYPRAAEVVELRYFGGLTKEETAAWLGISDASVDRDWTLARGWLARRLGSSGPRP